MLTVYRNLNCPASDEVQQRLRELTLAHRVVRLDDPTAPPPGDLPAEAASPILRDEEGTYVGSGPIQQHLEQLSRLKARWDAFGADACYCDGDGQPL